MYYYQHYVFKVRLTELPSSSMVFVFLYVKAMLQFLPKTFIHFFEMWDFLIIILYFSPLFMTQGKNEHMHESHLCVKKAVSGNLVPLQSSKKKRK